MKAKNIYYPPPPSPSIVKKRKKKTQGAPFPQSHIEFVAKNSLNPLPLPSLSTMKKIFNPKKCTFFPLLPSTFSYI
jgi:hypothetical protein